MFRLDHSDDTMYTSNDDDCIELVLATKDNTKDIGWLITDGEDSIEAECQIPFYSTVQEGSNLDGATWKDQAVVRQAKISWRDDTSISWMERHMEMTQGFMLVGGTAPCLFILGEPTHNRVDLTDEERSRPDFKNVKGYIIAPGCGIIIKKGTWHDFPVSVGPDVNVFIMNTREVVDALTSMKEPAPMDFGDCFKLSMVDAFPNKTLYFPDPRPFVASLGLNAGTDLKLAGSTVAYSSSSHESTITNEQDEDSPPLEERSEYGIGMEREEVDKWGGSHTNKVWVVPVINVESFVSSMFGPSVQPHLNKTQPEVANRGWRDYGNKRGLERLGNLFHKHDIPCTAVVSSDLVNNKDVMSLLRQFEKQSQWEIGAHGANNSNAGHVGLSEKEEALSISSSLDHLGAAFKGDRPKTWLTPGFSVTHSTPKLLSEAGVDTLLDFVDDDVPYKLVKKETSGVDFSNKPLVCIPYSMETNDFSLVLTRNLSPREYAAALESHISQLAEESKKSGTPRVVCVGMHTFVAGTPASVHEIDKVLYRLKANDNVHWDTAKKVTECVRIGTADLIPHEIATMPINDPRPTPQGSKRTIYIKASNPIGTVEIDRNEVGLILIDFQNDFLSHGGFGEGLGNDPCKLRRAIKPTQQVLTAFRKAGLPVIHTREGHRSNLVDVTSLKAGDGTLIGAKGQYGRSMVRGEWGHEIISDLKPLSNGSETIIDKPGKGAFYQTDLDLVLRTANINTLIVCGVTTEICVHSTVREANDRGIQCIVLEDCTASYFDEFHDVGLKMIAAQGGILGKVSHSNAIMDGLKS